eukprot:CAMPEP_0113666760 /NCGR_PEP_ID=MMETSP0038_2-20120614/3057_1 /TAXON_ID=2898 /ORGANISM="Cryptomonas paramecium" /LENGTH=558 /DNA_ID=CAMNT_0000582295 /DNA_START=48 /DNA_END=1721 /DNA_ORIENTATION=- /assembly_acc=CAM_ASM_000170
MSNDGGGFEFSDMAARNRNAYGAPDRLSYAHTNGHGPSSNEMMGDGPFQSQEHKHQENMRESMNSNNDESDEEGEVKEAGATRDLREEIEAKRVRRQGSKIMLINRDNEPPMSKRPGGGTGSDNDQSSGRRDQMYGDPPINGCYPNRPEFRKQNHQEFRRQGDCQVEPLRRRIPSPDSFRPRDVGLRRNSPARRPSPVGLRRSIGRSMSPHRKGFSPSVGDGRGDLGRGDHGRGDLGRGDLRHPNDVRMPAREHLREREQHPVQAPVNAGYGAGFQNVSNRACALRIRNIPPGLPAERIKNDLMSECYRYGRVLNVVLEYRGNERHAVATFAESTMAEDARRNMHRMLFHSTMLDVEIEVSNMFGAESTRRKFDEREGSGSGMTPFQEEMDDPCSNCRIIVDDIDEKLHDADVLSRFRTFGAMETFDIQRDRGKMAAIIRYRSLSSAVRARREMSGQLLGDRRCRIDYRFADPCCELWVGGVHMSVTDADVKREFGRYGRLSKVHINRANKCAYVVFERVDDAVQAASGMRGRILGSASWKLKVDFAERPQIRSRSPG